MKRGDKSEARKIFDKIRTDHLISYPVTELSKIFNLHETHISIMLSKRIKTMVKQKPIIRHDIDYNTDTGYEVNALELGMHKGEWLNSKERNYLKQIRYNEFKI